MNDPGIHRKTRVLLGLLLVLEAVVFYRCAREALGWINLNFPGFLLIENKVVAAAGCPFWQELKREELLHARLEEIDGQPLYDPEDLVRIVRSRPAGAPVTYGLYTSDGKDYRFRTTVHRFGVDDFVALFGVYLLNGLLYLGLGVLCVLARPREPSTPGFLAVGIATSLWTFTACDLYGPYHFFRLHVLAESLLPAAIAHLALVLPRPLLGRLKTGEVVTAIYLATLTFGAFYQALAFEPSLYPLFNRTATALLGISLFALLARCAATYLTAEPSVSRSGLRSLLWFAVAALVPSIFVSVSMALRGHPPVNYLGYTSFLLPIGLVLAVLQSSREEGRSPIESGKGRYDPEGARGRVSSGTLPVR